MVMLFTDVRIFAACSRGYLSLVDELHVLRVKRDSASAPATSATSGVGVVKTGRVGPTTTFRLGRGYYESRENLSGAGGDTNSRRGYRCGHNYLAQGIQSKRWISSSRDATGMTAKLAKTRIVMLDGVPYYSDSAVLKVMELRDLRKNLTPEYPFGGPNRVSIPEDKTEWNTPWTEYNPPEFTTASILQGDKEWADKELSLTDVGLWPKWNQQDGGINRRSHHGNYKTDADGYPLNPAGRTGIKGRGSLGRWATNHAADCLITRWKKAEDGTIIKREGRPVLQFIGIIRKDTGDAAFPGGMIDAGEDAMTAVKREFLEEVFSIDDATDEERQELEEALRGVFAAGDSVYKGYVDDRRNTDNAWIETEAINFSLNDSNDDVFRNLKFKAGSDAKGALWIDIDQNVKLYASHKSIIQILVQKLDAYW